MRHLYVDYFKCRDSNRQEEYDYCLRKNVQLGYFDRIFLVSSVSKSELPIQNNNIEIIMPVDNRTSFQFMFNLSNYSKDDINYIANSDIFFDESIQKIDNVMTHEVALGISRTYLPEDSYLEKGFHINGKAAPGSNDVWVWKGRCKVENAHFNIGYYSCDCRIMQCFVEAGYRVYNPAASITIWHKHKQRKAGNPPNVPGPYWNSPEKHHTIEEVK